MGIEGAVCCESSQSSAQAQHQNEVLFQANLEILKQRAEFLKAKARLLNATAALNENPRPRFPRK